MPEASQPEIDIRTDSAAWSDPAGPAAGSDALVRAAALAALAGSEVAGGPVEVSVLLTDDAAVAALNAEWRGREGPTNVLSFPGDDVPDHAPPGARLPDRPVLLGDVVVAYETVLREAVAGGLPFADHLRHLIVHGVLHLLGYDHESEAEAEEMEGLETEILATLGVSDPYAASDPLRERVT
ncbi:MAG: rRNA maturation RNase YbeY [Rhodospirillaceae bacterium]